MNFTDENSSSDTSMSGNVNNSILLVHPGFDKAIRLRNYIGQTSINNSFNYSFEEKPVHITINSDEECNEKVKQYKNNIPKSLTEQDKANLRAIASYEGKKVDYNKLPKDVEKLLASKDFTNILESRGLTASCTDKNALRIKISYPTENVLNTISDKTMVHDGRIA